MIALRLFTCFALLAATASWAVAADPPYLQRSVSEIPEESVELTTDSARYRPLFGAADKDSQVVQDVVRFGQLTVDPGGSSKTVNHPDEEQIYYVLEGTGMLHYGEQRVPISSSDFMYLPPGIEHGVSNPRERPCRLIVMGFRIPSGTQVPPTPKPMLANADDVQLQILGQHGPTTQFKLLMGPTTSRRDRLAATRIVSSLFIIDFAPGGTNIPHTHPREEEIYYILRGQGEMVAGTDADGNEMRHPSKQGDAFYFAPSTLIGFYSGTKEGQQHALIPAVRSMLAGAARGGGWGRGM